MDGGKRQNDMAKQFSLEIKNIARQRRAQAKSQRTSRDLENALHPEVGASRNPLTPQSPLNAAVELQGHAVHACDWESLPVILSPPESLSRRDSPNLSSTLSIRGGSNAAYISLAADSNASQNDFEPSLLMSYLDYAFPVLFPFYKPSVLEGGRSWLLTLALQHPTFYHNAIGLAAYFYCAVPVLPGPDHDACVEKAQTELSDQMQRAVQGVQDSLRSVNEKGMQNALSDSIRLLGNIVQLVNFEVAFATSDNWQMHLRAATNLFNQTLDHHGKDCGRLPMIARLLEKLRSNVPSNCSVWSAEQAALRFFTATVLYQDIIASTTLEKAPRLFGRYSNLINDTGSSGVTNLLNLEDFVGCQTWVLVSIAEISCLNEWKKESTRQGNFDIMVLVNNASIVQKRLRDGAARFSNTATNPPPHNENNPYRPLETILARSNITNSATTSSSTDNCLTSRIWAHAAHVYLITVLSGWQPAHLELRKHVAQGLELLRTIDNPSWLRTLSWPLCVLACLATEEQEPTFREMVNASGGLAMFGTLRDALGIMERVWSQRGRQKADAWDVAACLRVLGHHVLLV